MVSYSRRRLPRGTIVFLILWNLVLGSVLFTQSARDRALWLSPVFAAFIGIGTIVMIRRRRAIAPLLATSESESAAAQRTLVSSSEPDSRWVGGGWFPSWFGMMNASNPLAVLEVFGNVLRLRSRPRAAGLMFGIDPLIAEPNEVAEIFVALRFTRRGVGIRVKGGPSYFLWTSQVDEILRALESVGFPVSRQHRKVRLKPDAA